MQALTQQLKKGILEIIVLQLICHEDLYGYDIIKRMDTVSGGYFAIKEGSLYPILYRLEDKKLIESYNEYFNGERKVPRKYYRITENGKVQLGEMLQEWTLFQKTTNLTLNYTKE